MEREVGTGLDGLIKFEPMAGIEVDVGADEDYSDAVDDSQSKKKKNKKKRKRKEMDGPSKEEDQEFLMKYGFPRIYFTFSLLIITSHVVIFSIEVGSIIPPNACPHIKRLPKTPLHPLPIWIQLCQSSIWI